MSTEGSRDSSGSRKVLRARLSTRSDQIAIHWELEVEGAVSLSHRWWYLVDSASLKARIPGLRHALFGIQGLYGPNASKSPQLASALRKLAEEGQVLYETLMTSARTPEKAKSFRDWFESNVVDTAPGNYVIHFLLGDVRPLVPWGLTFTPRAERSLDSLEGRYDEFTDFWCIQHNVMSYPDQHHRPNFVIEPIKGDFKLTVVCEEGRTLWKVSRESLGDDELPCTKENLAASVRERRNWNHIMYFDLNVSSGSMSFGQEQLLPPDELSDILQKLRDSVTGFAFVDREAIIRGDRGEDWINTFFGRKWGGLIATEVNISNDSLQGYGLLLFSRIVAAERPASETISEIRREFWPWSLLYGVYCNADHLYLKPKPDFATDMLKIGQRLYTDLRERNI